MATIEVFPEDIFLGENKYLKLPDSVLDELKKYAPKNFNSLSSDNEKALQLKNEGLEVLFNIFSRSCMISASFADPEMSDVFVKEIKEVKKIEDDFYLFLMNNNWTLEVRKVYENLMWLCEKYLKISESFESRLGTKKHLRKLRAVIKNKNFELKIAKFLVIDPRRPLF